MKNNKTSIREAVQYAGIAVLSALSALWLLLKGRRIK